MLQGESTHCRAQGGCDGDGALVLSCFPEAIEVFGVPLLSIEIQMAQLNLNRMVERSVGEQDSVSL